jgi:hypothetical protein
MGDVFFFSLGMIVGVFAHIYSEIRWPAQSSDDVKCDTLQIRVNFTPDPESMAELKAVIAEQVKQSMADRPVKNMLL